MHLSRESIGLSFSAADWEAAVLESGRLLLAGGRVTGDYAPAMIEMVKEFGPYVVVAPGLAMPHARPEAGVLETGISFLTLKKPVFFPGREDNPVSMLIGLAAVSNTGHLDLMESLGGVVTDNEQLCILKNAESKAFVYDYFERRLK